MIQSISNYYNRLPYIVKFAFAATFIIGLLVHIFFFVGYYNQWDSIGNETINTLNPYTLFAQGRPIVPILQHISGAKNLPMVSGLVGLIYLALSSALITHVLSISSKIYAILIGASIVVFPSVACGYSYHLEGIIGGMFVAALCVYFCRKHNKKGIILGGIFCCLCLQTYQSDIFIVFSLLFVLLILDTLRGATEASVIFKRCIRYVLSFAIGVILWFGFWKLAVMIFNLPAVSYQGIGTVDTLPALMNFGAVEEVYRQFFTHMNKYTYEMFNIFGGSIFYISMLAGALTVILIIYRAWAGKVYRDKGKMALLCILLALYPMANCGVFLLGLIGTHVYTNMIFAIVINYVFLLAVAYEVGIVRGKRLKVYAGEQRNIRETICGLVLDKASTITALVLVVLIANNLFLTEEAYLKTNISNQQVAQFSGGIVDRIERYPGFDKAMPIIFVGLYISDNTGQYDYNPIIGFPTMCNTVNGYTFGQFAHKLTGHKLNFVYFPYNEEMRKSVLQNAKAIGKLDIYPKDNSIVIIDQVMYVKLGSLTIQVGIQVANDSAVKHT